MWWKCSSSNYSANEHWRKIYNFCMLQMLIVCKFFYLKRIWLIGSENNSKNNLLHTRFDCIVFCFFFFYIYRHVRLARLTRPDRFRYLDLEFLHQHLHLLSPWQHLLLYHLLVDSLHRHNHSSKLRQRETLTPPLCVASVRRRSRTLWSGRWRSSNCSETCRSVSPTPPSHSIRHYYC